jgi:hypothetical protein
MKYLGVVPKTEIPAKKRVFKPEYHILDVKLHLCAWAGLFG